LRHIYLFQDISRQSSGINCLYKNVAVVFVVYSTQVVRVHSYISPPIVRNARTYHITMIVRKCMYVQLHNGSSEHIF